MRNQRKWGIAQRFRLVVLLVFASIAPLLFGASFAKADAFTTGEFVSYGQGQWALDSAAETLLSDHFGDVYNGMPVFELVVGNTTPGNFNISFDGAAGVENYFPSAGPPAALTATMLDPETTTSGVYGGDVTGLALDIDFDNAGYLGTSTVRFENLVLTGLTGSLSGLNGLSIAEFLALTEAALSGGPTTYSYADLDYVTSNISTSFVDGEVQDFAIDHLELPEATITSPVAEPPTCWVLLIGLAGLGSTIRRRHSSEAQAA